MTTPRRSAPALWLAAPGRAEIRPTPLPPAGDGTVTVRTLFSGVSRGTESLVFHGRVPDSARIAMRAPFQEGEFPAPVKYGYAAVGLAEDGALAGCPVFCLYPHQARFVVPEDAVVPVPDAVPPGRAVLAANMETAVNALWDAGAGIGDRIAVVGGGTVGFLVALLAARLPGARVLLVDPDDSKRALAARLGLAASPPDSVAGPGHDRVFHASASDAGLATAIALAGDEATVVEMSWYGDRTVRAPLGDAFHYRRLTLLSSQVGQVSPGHRPRWRHRDRLALALDLLADPVFDALITSEGVFADLPADLARLAADGGGVLCHRVVYPFPPEPPSCTPSPCATA